MKKQLNLAIQSSGIKVDEEALFREMAYEFNNNGISKATYVETIHKAYVEFPSNYKVSGTARVELGDLLLLTYNKANKELRMCILQAKYKKESYRNFLNFIANIFQWELLDKKPCVTNHSRKYEFPSNILNFRRDYKSITAYGIFYHDNISGEIDFLYTLPEHIEPCNYPKRRIQKGERMFNFRCPIRMGSPNVMCNRGLTPKEAISTCSLDVFEILVLSGMIGAPIDSYGVKEWVFQLLSQGINRASNPDVISELLAQFDWNEERVEIKYHFENIPSIMLVITDSESLYVQN